MTLDEFVALRDADQPNAVRTNHWFGREARVLVDAQVLPAEQSDEEWHRTFMGWAETLLPQPNLQAAYKRGRRMRAALADLGKQTRARRAKE